MNNLISKNIKKLLLKYFDFNKNQKIDWWECLTFIKLMIMLILFFVGLITLLL